MRTGAIACLSSAASIAATATAWVSASSASLARARAGASARARGFTCDLRAPRTGMRAGSGREPDLPRAEEAIAFPDFPCPLPLTFDFLNDARRGFFT